MHLLLLLRHFQIYRQKFGVTFPLFTKVLVNGEQTHPLFVYLKAAKPGLFGVQWIYACFTKFLVDRKGQVVMRFGPTDTSEKIESEVVKLLSASMTAEKSP